MLWKYHMYFTWNVDRNTHSNSYNHRGIWVCTQECRKKQEVCCGSSCWIEVNWVRNKAAVKERWKVWRQRRRTHKGVQYCLRFYLSQTQAHNADAIPVFRRGRETFQIMGGGTISHVQDWIRERYDLIAWLLLLEIWPQKYWDFFSFRM